MKMCWHAKLSESGALNWDIILCAKGTALHVVATSICNKTNNNNNNIDVNCASSADTTEWQWQWQRHQTYGESFAFKVSKIFSFWYFKYEKLY